VGEHNEIFGRGSKEWNKWREAQRHLHVRPDLNGLSVSRNMEIFDLDKYDLSAVRLRGARFSKVNLDRIDLTDADCREAQFSAMSLDGCNLTNADFRNAKFFNCYLRQANLTGTNFAGALFKNVDFEGATVNQTIFGNDDLSGTVNLDRAIHRGSVIIGTRALEESRGRIPPTFLEKARVPPEILRIALEWAKRPVAYSSCFISHSSADKEFIERVRNQLTNDGVSAFLSSKNLRPGQQYPLEIERQLLSAGKVIVVISRRSLSSTWVRREVQTTMERERREGQFLIIPVVSISADEWEHTDVDWAFTLRESVHAVIFYRREFDSAYQQLLDGLRIAATSGAPFE
jgi:uncharacterized protein YjbI with pentapeptide repeats